MLDPSMDRPRDPHIYDCRGDHRQWCRAVIASLTYSSHNMRRLMKKRIDVVGAVVVSDGQVLCVQRGPHGALPGKWEFPGGKVEPGEASSEALVREIDEELHCQVTVGEAVTTTTHEYEFATVTLATFYCSIVDGRPSLTEHAELRWLSPDELRHLDWAPADIPAVALVANRLTRTRT